MTEPTSSVPSAFRSSARPLVNLAGIVLLVAVLALPSSAAFGVVGPAGHVAAPVSVHAASLPVAPSLSGSAAVAGLPSGLQASVLAHLHQSTLGLPDPHFTGSAWTAGHSFTRTGATWAPSSHPAAGPTNSMLPSSDCSSQGPASNPPSISGSNMVQVGPSAQTLLVGSGTAAGLYNVTGATPCSAGIITTQWLGYGYTVNYRSTDGGATWTQNLLPQNTTLWQGVGGAESGSITSGSGVIAAGPNNVALQMTGYAPSCLIFFQAGLNCTAPAGIQAPWGFGISRSTDGGFSWSNATQVSAVTAVKYLNFPTSCAAVGLNPGYYYNMIPERNWVSTDGVNAVAGWDVFNFNWDVANCTNLPQATVFIVSSTDGGATWSSQKAISNVVSDTMSLAEGATAGTFYSVFADFANSTTSTYTWAFVKSTDSGATWSTEKDMGTNWVNPTSFTGSSYPDAFGAAQVPALAADNWSSSPHSGNLYVVWQDNQTGGNQGQVAIALTRSVTGGSTWTTPVYLTAPTGATNYLMPTVSVGPDGIVWVTYYAVTVSPATGSYRLVGEYSTDGGVTWSSQFVISDTASNPGSAIVDLGIFTGDVAIAGGVLPVWADTRTTITYDVQVYTAQVHALNVSAVAASPVAASVSVFGITTTPTLPLRSAFDLGASVTVQVPQNVPIPGNLTYVDAFTSWSGETASGNFRTTFTYAGGPSLVATYSPVPAAFIRGYFSPNIAGASLLLDGSVVPLAVYNTTAYQYLVSVPSGQSYYLNASAPNYVGSNQIVPVSSGATQWVNFSLVRMNGFLTGVVSPADAFLTLNSVTNVSSFITAVTGVFNIPVPFGYYWLNASKPGYTSQVCQGSEVFVAAGQATVCNFNLVGGWINGTVTPAKTGLQVQISGVVVTTSFGAFSMALPGGFYTVTATQPGYNLSVIQGVHVVPGHGAIVNVSLTNYGHLAGLVTPAAALKGLTLYVQNGSLGGPQVYDQNLGTFNVPLPGGYNWTITAKSPGYNTTTTHMAVSAGNTSNVAIVMGVAVTPPCTTNCPPPPPNNGTPTTNSLPLLWIGVGVLVIVVIVALVVAMMMMRRGRGGGEMESTAPPEHLYEGTSPSELPKLQSDGSMGEGQPPSG